MRGRRVETDKGLIHDDELRRMQKRGDDRELLLHAVRVAGDRLGQIARQIKKVRVAMNAALPVLLRNAEDIRNKIQVLNAGEKFVEVGVIRDVGDGVICDGFPRDENLTAVRLQNAAAGLDGGRLACAVVADEGANLARGDMQRQIAHRELVAEGLCQMVDH